MSGAISGYARSEIRRLYRQPLAWIVLAAGAGGMAVVFMLLVIRYLDGSAELHALGVTAAIVVPYFSIATLTVLLLTPILTMASIAGDKRDGMLRFLYSTPLTSAAIVTGKLLGISTLVFMHLALTAVMPLTLLWGAPIDLGVYATNLAGLVLFALMHNGLGLMASALTRAPVASAIIAFAISLTLWSAAWADRIDPQSSGVGGISTLGRLRGFSGGLVITADVIYFCAATLAFFAITVLLVEADRKLP